MELNGGRNEYGRDLAKGDQIYWVIKSDLQEWVVAEQYELFRGDMGSVGIDGRLHECFG